MNEDHPLKEETEQNAANNPQGQNQGQPLEVEYSVSGGLLNRLHTLNLSFAFTSYQSGLLYFVGRDGQGGISVHQTGLPKPMGLSLVWFGIVTVVGAEIGLLTPPLGISCFVIKSTLNDDRISLKDVFLGALPFAGVMLVVLILLIRFPALSLAILN